MSVYLQYTSIYISFALYIHMIIICSQGARDLLLLNSKMPTDVSHIWTDTTLDHSLQMASRTPPFFREEIKHVVGLRHLNSSDLCRLLS